MEIIFPCDCITGNHPLYNHFLSAFPDKLYLEGKSGLEIIKVHRSGYPIMNISTDLDPIIGVNVPSRLDLEVDGEFLLSEAYDSSGSESKSQVFEKFRLTPGIHEVRLIMQDREDRKLEHT